MNIVYCYNEPKDITNKEQITLLLVSLKSLLIKSTDIENIYIITYNIHSTHRKWILEASGLLSNKINFIEFPSKFENDLRFMMKKSVPANEGTFLRLFIGELLPKEIKKCLYLDTDTIINRNLYDFFSNFNIAGIPIAASLDTYELFSRKKEIKLGLKNNSYFNAGILILNLDLIRNSLLEDILNVFSKHNNIFADQDALNILFNENFRELPVSMNTMVNEYYDNNAYIFHYAARGKLLRNRPEIIHSVYKKIFWGYIKSIGFYSLQKPQINIMKGIIFIIYKLLPNKLIYHLKKRFCYL